MGGPAVSGAPSSLDLPSGLGDNVAPVFVIAEDVPVPKDVVVATLGASAALAGLVLVFLGMTVTTYQSFAADDPPSVKAGYKWSIIGAVVVFAIALGSVALGLIWLAAPGGTTLYHANIWLFAAEIVGIFAIALVMTCGVLRG